MNEEDWKLRVIRLNFLERILDIKFESGKINKVEREIFKKRMNKEWIKIWDYYPYKNDRIAKAFKEAKQ